MKKRTNIELEMDYVEEIMERHRLRTITAAVDLALQRLAVEPMTREEALAMEGSMPDYEPLPDPPPLEEI